VSITVRELLAIPHLHLRLHSGAEGLDHEVGWTHTSDLPRPWEWLGHNELLMTNGMSFPGRAAEQHDLVHHLSRVGASALAVGEGMYCPPLTSRFTQASNQLELPVLWISYPLPFSSISRAVAEATLLEQSHRLMQTARIYDAIRTSPASSGEGTALIEALTRELNCPVYVCDRNSGEPWFPRTIPPPAEVVSAIRRAASGGANRIAGAQSLVLADDTEVLIAEVPTHAQAVLVVVRPPGVPLDGILIQHAATVVALDLSQATLGREHVRREGAEALGQMLDGRTDQRSTRRQLTAANLIPAGSLVGALTGAPPERMRDIYLHLWRRQIPHLITIRNGITHVIIPASEAAASTLTDALGPLGRVGLSAPLRSASRVAEASREALWALSTAERTEQPLTHFTEVPTLSWFNEIEEAQSIVDQVLGPLLTYEATHQTGLVETLEQFLTLRRSWQATATALHLHRQTVRYRIKNVEKITGRSLTETSDIAQLWLALQAHRQLAGHR